MEEEAVDLYKWSQELSFDLVISFFTLLYVYIHVLVVNYSMFEVCLYCVVGPYP